MQETNPPACRQNTMTVIDASESPLYAVETAGPEETGAQAATIFQKYFRRHRSVLLLLDGAMGSGKTTFVSQLGRMIEFAGIINSPTFNLLNIYEGNSGTIYHYDLYRLGDASELYELDFLDRWAAHTRLVERSAAEPNAGQKNAGALENQPTQPFIELHAIEWWRKARELIPHLPVHGNYRLEISVPPSDGSHAGMGILNAFSKKSAEQTNLFDPDAAERRRLTLFEVKNG